MKLRSVLVLGLWLVAGTALPTSAQLSLRQDTGAPLCDAPTAVAGTAAEHALLATVTRVDAGQGQLEFTTETGVFVLTTTPTAIHDLRVGDQLFICLHEEGSDGTERVAEEAPIATTGAP